MDDDAPINGEVVEDSQAAAEGSHTELVLPGQVLPETLYLMPVTGRPFMPGQIQPMLVETEPWGDTIRRVAESDQNVMALCLVDVDDLADVSPEHFMEFGVAAKLHKASGDERRVQFIVQGIKRLHIKRWINRKPPFVVQAEYLETNEPETDEIRAYAMAIIGSIKELLPLNPLYNEELKQYLNRFSADEPSELTDFASTLTSASAQDLQEILETLPLMARMEKVLPLLRKEVEVGRLQEKISSQVNETISERQREFFLREQMKAIQKELGISKDDKSADVERFRERLMALDVPGYAMSRIEEELDKLQVLETGSPEYGVTRNYLDWVTSVPWGVTSKDRLELDHAREVLEAEHDGLEDVKERILEFLAVGAYRQQIARLDHSAGWPARSWKDLDRAIDRQRDGPPVLPIQPWRYARRG